MNLAPISVFEDSRALYGAAPISDSAPAGTDVRGEPDFEEVEAEVRRMDVDGPGAVAWSKVGPLALKILSSRSKDVLVAAWATYALFRTEGYQGLAVGIGILRGMVEAHWDTLFPPPKRERARVAAIDWLVGRVAPALADKAPTETDQPAVLAAYDALDDLDRLLGEKLQKEQAALGELFRALKPHREEARRAIEAAADAARAAEEAKRAEEARREAAAAAPLEVAAPTPAPQPAAAPAAPSSASAPVVPAAPASGDWWGFLGTLPETLHNLSGALMAAAPLDERAFLLNRVGSFLRIRELPPNAELFPPSDINAVEVAAAAGKHAEVLALTERMVWTDPFWLDAHRYAHSALEQLQPEPHAAAATVRSAAAVLVARFPAILELQFKSGLPFADEETRALLSQGSGGGADRNPAAKAVAEANTLFAAGRMPDAFAALGRAVNGAATGRDRFIGQVAQAAFCLDRGFTSTAIPLLDHLDQVVTAHALETWEPVLALQVAELRYRAISTYEAQQLMDETRRRAALDSARVRVARLDIALASRLGQ